MSGASLSCSRPNQSRVLFYYLVLQDNPRALVCAYVCTLVVRRHIDVSSYTLKNISCERSSNVRPTAMECPAHYEPTLTTADQEGRAGWRVPAWADDGDDCPGNPLVAHLHPSVARLSVVGIARPISHGFVSARSGTAVRPTTVRRERSAGDAPGVVSLVLTCGFAVTPQVRTWRPGTRGRQFGHGARIRDQRESALVQGSFSPTPTLPAS